MGACTGTTLRSASSWDRDARWANLFWNKLCSLGSGSGLPPITSGFSTVCPTTQWSHLRILLWRPPHLPTAPGNHLPPPPLLLSCHQGLRHLLLHPGLPLHPLQPPRLPDPVCPLRGVGHLSPSSSPAHCAGRQPACRGRGVQREAEGGGGGLQPDYHQALWCSSRAPIQTQPTLLFAQTAPASREHSLAPLATKFVRSIIRRPAALEERREALMALEPTLETPIPTTSIMELVELTLSQQLTPMPLLTMELTSPTLLILSLQLFLAMLSNLTNRNKAVCK